MVMHEPDTWRSAPTFDKDQSELRAALFKEVGITPGDALQGVLATLSPIVSAILARAAS